PPPPGDLNRSGAARAPRASVLQLELGEDQSREPRDVLVNPVRSCDPLAVLVRLPPRARVALPRSADRGGDRIAVLGRHPSAAGWQRSPQADGRRDPLRLRLRHPRRATLRSLARAEALLRLPRLARPPPCSALHTRSTALA